MEIDTRDIQEYIFDKLPAESYVHLISPRALLLVAKGDSFGTVCIQLIKDHGWAGRREESKLAEH
jgi:hypothetical protein